MSSIISINLDSFIYAVRQAFDARSRANGEFNSHLKYTPFLENTWEKPSESSLSALKTPLEDIIKHHWSAIPHYQKNVPVDLENISWFAHSIAAMIADIDFLLKSVLGSGLPQKDNSTEESQKIWELITNSVQNVFQAYATLFEAYVEWKYNPPVEKKESVDWNVRPPCGVLYRTEFKALFDEIRNARFGKKFQHSKPQDRHKDKEHHKEEHKEKESAHKENNEKPRDSKNQRSDTKEKHSPKNRWDKPTRERRPKPLNEDSVESLQPALDECKKALETMKSNPNIREIPLSAQNSFVRRHQHTFVTEAGFESDSRGEGAERHVCIIQK